MILSDIYKKYKITSNLQTHMLRVASFAWLIIDNFSENISLDKPAILQACLFHDIAKILSFKNVTPEEEIIQAEYAKKYGPIESIATERIVAEIPLSIEAQEIIRMNDMEPFVEKIRRDASSSDYAMKILRYSDSRTSPAGLVTIAGRWEELVQRYPEKRNNPENVEVQELMLSIERQLQENCLLDFSAITQEQIESQILGLLSLDL